ncbi:hypothetical protein BDAP_000646 [Binucleata daphniae]
MATSNNYVSKNFVYIFAGIGGIIIFAWILVWAFSEPTSDKPIDNVSEESENVMESESIVEGSGAWDEDKWGWRRYDKRYGQRSKTK